MKNLIICTFVFLFSITIVLNILIMIRITNLVKNPLKNITTFALIIPIHPKHYHYIYDLIRIIDINLDLFLVFTNQNEYESFERQDRVKKIVIPEITTGNIVTFKKYFALEQLKNTNYKYFIVCDAEITIVPENFNEKNIFSKINKIFKNKIIYAGETNDENINSITKNSVDLIIDKEQKLEKITKNYKLYFWWSDLPVYKKDHLTHFFSVINYNNLTWYHFDHVIYTSYLLLYQKFNIVNITPILNIHWSLESYNTLDIDNLHKLQSNKYGFSFITKQLYDNHKEFLQQEGCFLLYHLDRQ